ncbi:MAG: DUF2075 domain-containing protein [Bacilli bacterium]|nr:DUF2075 domain-containing protein [Bacilli bacterium]
MLVYEGIKSGFIEDVDLGIIADKIRNKYIEVIKKRPSAPEFNSWKNSMQYMRGVLSDNDIPNNIGIAIEYNIPPTGCRIDFMMSGYKQSKSNVVIIELKQWDKATEVGEMDGIYKVNTFTGGGMRDVNHPSYQAMTYANLIRDYNESVQLEDINVVPCAYLHNYYFDNDDTLLSNNYKEYVEAAPLFGHNDVLKLRDFIKRYIEDGDEGNILYEIDHGRIRPSKMLQDSLSQMLKGNKEFYMIDSQKIVYEYALRYAIDTVASNSKNVMIVRGGPGTGKSVLAINLLVELNNRNMTCFYVTKNAAPRTVYAAKLRGEFTATHINHLFQGSGGFYEEETNKLDCLVVDEAHRLNEKSGLFQNRGENQIKEIINAAKFSIFFIDENQKVTLKDIGSEDLIRKFAQEQGAGIYTYELDSQFRCNGSDGYVAWLDNTLEIRDTANFDIEGFDYDFKVFDDPNEMRREIEEKNKINNKSRIVAGYCWEWPTGNTRNDSNYHEIKIPEKKFEISWNLESGEAFAIGENSINEAGCIHTVQGLEFDYVGVIIGDDMRYEDGHIVTDYTKRARSDNSLKGINRITNEQGEEVANKIADTIIKNTYRTLMTRGMKGCYVYCTDKELQEYLKNS